MAGSVAKDKVTGLWYYIFELGRDENGKRKQKKKRGFKTKKEAELALAETEVEKVKGTQIEPLKITLNQYMEKWFQERKLALKECTHTNYCYLYESYVRPKIGRIKLESLNHVIMQDFVNELVEKTRLSSGSIHKILDFLQVAFKKAFRTKIIKENPLEYVTRPKLIKKEMKVWSLEQVNYFLTNGKSVRLQNQRYYTGFMIALLTGMRQGEILGLRWSDVDLEEGIIYVRQTLTHDGKTLQAGTKTRSGLRSIYIPKILVDELLKQREFYENDKRINSKKGLLWNENDLVVCSKKGKPIIPTNFVIAFKRIVKKLGLPEIRFHDMRHSHATLLLQNVNPKIVSERLGHSRIGITLDTYSHVLPSMQKEVANKLDEMMNVASPSGL